MFQKELILIKQMHHIKLGICHYYHFLYKGFTYEPYLCNGCHDLMQKAINFNDVVIVFINGSDYRIYFWNMSKNDAINIIKIFDLNEKTWIVINFLLYIKLNDRTNYYQRNKERILNRAKKYYKSNKKVLR